MIRQLVDHAKYEFELDKTITDSKGRSQGSRREHLEQAEKTLKGAAQGELDNPNALPEGAGYLYSWFLELGFHARTYGPMGPGPISNAELWAWCQLNHVALRPWELRALRLLDAAWMTSRRSRD